MSHSKEVETFLSRLDHTKRAELERLLQPDAITLLATIEDPVLAQRLVESQEKLEMLLPAFASVLGSAEASLARGVAECVLRECVARVSRASQ